MNIKQKHKYLFIYITTNLINGKSYVGFHATNNLNDGYLGSGVAIKRAIKKYGCKNFSNKILENCNEENWQQREQYWIKEKNTFNKKKGYNLSDGGEGSLGFKMSKKMKDVLSLKGMGRNISKETREKISEALKGRPTWNKGMKDQFSDEYRAKISKANTGKKKSEEEKKAMSERMKGDINPGRRDDVKAKVSKAMKGKFAGKNNPMSGTSRSINALEKYKELGIELKGDKYEYMRQKIKCINIETQESFLFDGVKELTQILKISKNKYYRSLKDPAMLPMYKFEKLG